MKTTKKQRQVIAWMLILCMLPLVVVKLTHHHHAEEEDACPAASHADNTGHTHHHDDCSICKFTLSPFLGFEITDNTLFLAELFFEPSFYLSEPVLDVARYTYLRAPPHC